MLGEQPPPLHLVTPSGAASNAADEVSALSDSFGVTLDPWQELVLEAALGERANGIWTAKQVGLSAPRQNGKSQLIVARALAGALLFGEKKIIISAHAQDTARETFGKLLEQIEQSPALEDRVAKVMNALNREYVKFVNGAVIQFKARTVSGSRGFSCDCLLLDEAQILGMPAWVSINSTMSARPNPQVWLLGTPPTPEDNPEVFRSVRTSALSGKSRAVAWAEWAAKPTDDPAAEETRRAANPAWDTRINHEIVQGEYETYPPDRFALDRLGIWPEDLAPRIVTAADWSALAIPAAEVPTGQPAAFAVDAGHDRRIQIGVCVRGTRDHIELAAVGDVAGSLDTLQAVEWLTARAGRRIPVVVDSYSPAASMVPALKAARVNVIVTNAGDMAKACGDWFDAVAAGTISHFDQAAVNQALASAKKRPIGQAGGWGLDRTNPEANISPLVTLILALYGARLNTKPKTGRVMTSA